MSTATFVVRPRECLNKKFPWEIQWPFLKELNLKNRPFVIFGPKLVDLHLNYQLALRFTTELN